GVDESAQSIAEHFEEYPDVDIITGTDNINLVPGDAQVVFRDEFISEHVASITQENLDAIGTTAYEADGSVYPVLTILISSLRELDLLVDGHTDIASAAKNIGLD